jgi:hypothetical protein
MGRSKVTFNIKAGGIARASENYDNVSALVFYTVTNILPASGYTTAIPWKEYTNIAEIEADFITSSATGVVLEAWYQCNQFFANAPNSTLWLSFISGTTYNFQELLSLQKAAASKIRRFGVSTYSRAFSTTDLNALQVVKESLDDEFQNSSIFYAPNVQISVFTGSSATDLRDGTFSDEGVLTLIGSNASDSGSVGYAIELANSATTSQLGSAVGIKSVRAINNCIGDVSQNNVSDGVENEKLRVGGVDYNSITNTILDNLCDKGYVYLTKYNDVPGSYFCSDFNGTHDTNDVNRISIAETQDKIIRNVYQALVLFINTTVDYDPATGRIPYDQLMIWTNAAEAPLNVMIKNFELTTASVFIDPNQNVVSTSEVNVSITYSIYGIAQDITVDLTLTA